MSAQAVSDYVRVKNGAEPASGVAAVSIHTADGGLTLPDVQLRMEKAKSGQSEVRAVSDVVGPPQALLIWWEMPANGPPMVVFEAAM